ncbi:MAG: hypothetical protein WDO73_22890 [Ignavibacteriota bacterium]
MNPTKASTEFAPRILAESTVKSSIEAPTADIDVTDWLFHIDELEYNNCTPKSKAHITAGFTHAPDGKMMSINVEYVAGALFIEHYVEDVSEKLHCRVKSVSTLLVDNVFTTVHVIWELIVNHQEGDRHEFTDNVWVHTTKEYEQYLIDRKIPYEEARKGFQAGVDAHNAEEAPEFAASIQRKALKKK